MPLRFVEKRIISVVEELSPTERSQLQVAGKLYDGNDLPAATRLAGGADEDDGSLFDTELWKLVDGGRHVYDAWFYMGDSGTFFRAGTTEVVAEVVQCGLECEDRELRTQLGPAMVEAKLLPAGDSSYEEFSRLLLAQQGMEGGEGSVGTGEGDADDAEEWRGVEDGVKAQAERGAGKKAAAKKPAPKKAAPKKAAPVKKAAAKKPAAKKAAPKKAAAKKPTAKKAAPRKGTVKKPAVKRPMKRR